MKRTNMRIGVISSGVVFLIVLPFVKPLIAVTLAVAAGLFMLLTEGGLWASLFKPADGKDVSDRKTAEVKPNIIIKIVSGYPVHVRWGLVVFAGLLPFGLDRYTTEIMTLAMIYVTLSVGLNFIVGLSGLLALGYIAFYAVGAYTYALLSVHYHLNFFLCLPIGFCTGAIAGGLVGLPVLRLRGDYLAIVTLGFGEITRIILNNWDELTEGPNGIMGIARPDIFGINLGTPLGYYYIAVLLAIAVMFVQSRVINSKLGRAWEAIREDELAAAHVGVP
ncbi:MAG: hypothetical protein P9M15_02435, partial [Candidatus Electryoneaceae bacterium]|nr:hypothetical protein [Candidatus Electryoneaceae bacterium]